MSTIRSASTTTAARGFARPQVWRRALGLALLLPALALAEGEQRFTITVQQERAGHMVTTPGADGELAVDFSYRDNGRGPDLKETIRVDAQGVPLHYRVEGTSTFGGPIRERFDLEGGTAHWVSLVDRGDKPVPAGALYYPIEFSVEMLAQVVRAVLANPDHAAPAVAGGRFTVERLAQLRLATTAGEVPVALYALTGADAAPVLLWLRDDDSRALVAQVFPWWQLVREGFEPHTQALLDRQRLAEAERLEALQKRLAKPLPGLTAIRGVRWFDARDAVMRGPSDVFVFDGRIAAVLPAAETRVDALAPDWTVDGRGKTLLPGLYDMHAHIDPQQGLMNLAAGVTTVRDLANDNTALFDLMRRWEAGIEAGPRVLANGFIEGKSPFSARNGFVVDTLDDALKAVDWYAARGYRQLKLYNSIKPAWVKPIADRAHALGLRVGGHVPAFMRAEEAVRAGYDELHHINQVMLNFFVTPKDDTRTLLRFTLVGDKARDVALDGPRVRAFIQLLREHGTVVDPTAGTFESMFNQRNGEPSPSYQMVADHMPVAVQRFLRSNTMDVNDSNADRYRTSYARMLEMIRLMHRSGVPLVAGTDSWPGFGLHRELELYEKAGIPPLQVLKIATWNGARYSGTQAEAGSIERGKRADLVLVDGDPSRHVADIRRVSLVFKGGTAYAPAQAYEAMGIQPFVPAAAIEPGTGAR